MGIISARVTILIAISALAIITVQRILLESKSFSLGRQ